MILIVIRFSKLTLTLTLTVTTTRWELGFLEGICFAILIGLSCASPRTQSPCPSPGPGPSLRMEPQESLP